MPLRGGDGLSAGPDDTARPRLVPLLFSVLAIVALAWYGIPALSTEDPLWPLPPDTRADVITLHWDGRHTELRPGDEGYAPLMRAVNGALGTLDGIEYRYGLSDDDVERLRASGRALEASYHRPARAHGVYAVGTFTRLLVALDGPEHDRKLIFLGDARGFRSGPLRARDLGDLRGLAVQFLVK